MVDISKDKCRFLNYSPTHRHACQETQSTILFGI
jgi:hypothetical protein